MNKKHTTSLFMLSVVMLPVCLTAGDRETKSPCNALRSTGVRSYAAVATLTGPATQTTEQLNLH